MNLREKIEKEYTAKEIKSIFNWFFIQGREGYDTETKEEIIVKMGKRKMMSAVEHIIDLYDLDRWNISEAMLGMELDWQNVQNLNAALWENDIEILDLGIPTR